MNITELVEGIRQVTAVPARWATRIGARFGRDRRGATAVQAIVLLPAVLFFFAAGAALWQTVNIRKSLNNGTYEALRFLSLYPPQNLDTYYWGDIATEIIKTELENNPWVSKPILDSDLTVTVTLRDQNNCGDKFDLYVAFNLFAPVGARDPTTASGILPNMAPIKLVEERQGEVVCP